MGPGDGHLGVPLHEAGLHLPPAQDGAPAGPGRHQFGVVFLHRGGVHHHLGGPQIFGVVPLVDGHPQGGEARQDGAAAEVGAAHLVALTHQKLRQSAHADAADADEVVGSYKITPYAALIRRFLDNNFL